MTTEELKRKRINFIGKIKLELLENFSPETKEVYSPATFPTVQGGCWCFTAQCGLGAL